jgi:hypothetical protein
MVVEEKQPDGYGQTAVGTAGRVGSKLIESLPAQFMVLVLLNGIYVIGMLWFLNIQADRRDQNLGPIITSCMQQVPISVVERLFNREQQDRDILDEYAKPPEPRPHARPPQ